MSAKLNTFLDNYKMLNGQRKKQTPEILQTFVKLYYFVLKTM